MRVEFIETESRMVVAISRGKGRGEVVFNGYRVLVLQAEKVLDKANKGNIFNPTEVHT